MKRTSRILFLAAPLLAIAATGVALAAQSPSVSTGSASSTLASNGTANAAFNGQVNPNGSTTTYHFEWGLNTSYGDSSPGRSAGHGTKLVSVSLQASGLIPGTLYHYRLDASNAAGTTLGADRTFTTAGNPPPGASTGPANDVGQSSADLTGEIAPNGQSTGYVFQYGLSTAYGYQTFGGTVAPGTTSPVTVTNLLEGLEPGTTFHYRLVAYHGSVAVPGADGTFVTEPNPRPYPRLTAHTTPRVRPRRPYSFTTSGKVVGPAAFPAADECTGTVTVRFLVANRQFTHLTVPLNADCTYAATAVLHRIPGQNRRHPRQVVRVIVHFSGNGYVAPKESGATDVTVD